MKKLLLCAVLGFSFVGFVQAQQACSTTQSNVDNFIKANPTCGCIQVAGEEAKGTAGKSIFVNSEGQPVRYCIDLQEEIAGVKSIEGQDGLSLFSDYIKQIYLYGASIIGIICVLIIVISGIQISLGGANSEFVNQGKERIMQAMLSMILLFGSAVILRTVNPGFFTIGSQTVVNQQNIEEAFAGVPEPGAVPETFAGSTSLNSGANPNPGGATAAGSEHAECPIVPYKGINVHTEFKSDIDTLERIARDLGIEIVYTSSFRAGTASVNGQTATQSRHRVGFAVDLNLNINGSLCSRQGGCLSQGREPEKVIEFVNQAIASGLRWGGNFRNNYDPVHFDRNVTNWTALRTNIESTCPDLF